ncbi:DDE Tnp4 domain-containing protein [Citrus sinensis]|uniref:DDE Tnp4 domain-containing protein n=1 Tax=Citrus sinensis TaxID=2711 RepID=A0ACB8M554_CITSI|nr:DDE Tnp4 domain-containing protein [Citrus sinensis]
MIRSQSFINHASQLHYLDSIIGNGDLQCVHQLRMDRRTFGLLCELLRSRGKVKADGLVTVEEQVCMFLHILSHHVKNRTISSRFFRSGETVSRYFNSVLKGVLRLQSLLLKAPEPVPENYTDGRWRWFKNCLGALDGTYIRVRVPENDKPRYRTRKGEIATNVLGVCSRDMKFIFVMPGWEGSASDSRILRDAISKPTGLRVPTGMTYD